MLKKTNRHCWKGLLLTFCCGLFITASAKGRMNTGDDFYVRGFHLDLRIQVMKMPALKQFAKKMSENGINTLVMEWEGAYPYEKHTVISNRYAYTRSEVISFVDYCDSLGIDVVPLQQSFGHVEYILKNYRYKDLREDQKDYSQVNPTKEDLCKALFTDLYQDMISTHRSPYIHIGGDETYLLGHSKESKEKADRVGMGRLYGDYIKMLCELVIALGKRPIVWADIALKYPDALQSLPKETIFVDWNYGWELDRFGDHGKLMESGFEIWGSPAIRSHPDNYFLADWGKHLDNIKNFIPQARGLGYKGIVMTSWSTSGIYSPIAESHSDFIDLHAVRRVYPISGFNMLIEAFFEGMKEVEAFNPDDFVVRYAMDRYGLGQQDAKLFWHALKLAPYEVNQGKVSKGGVSIEQLADSALFSFEMLKSIEVKKNKEEFGHYILMSNMRYNYLVCIGVESAMNSSAYALGHADALQQKLKSLNISEVDQQFYRLNSQLLYESELEKENALRNHRYYDLLATLKKHKIF